MTPQFWLSSVSYTAEFWFSGVNYTAELWLSGVIDTAESWLYCRSCTKISFHWLSGVNDTTQFGLSGVNDTSETCLSGAIDTAESWLSGVIGDLKLEYLCKLASFFETILGCESEALREMFDEKNRRSKISWDCPVKPPVQVFRFNLL